MAEIELKKVVLKVGDTEISLDLKSILELRDILNGAFPEKEVRWIPSVPYPVYPRWSYTTWLTSTHETSDTLYLSSTAQG